MQYNDSSWLIDSDIFSTSCINEMFMFLKWRRKKCLYTCSIDFVRLYERRIENNVLCEVNRQTLWVALGISLNQLNTFYTLNRTISYVANDVVFSVSCDLVVNSPLLDCTVLQFTMQLYRSSSSFFHRFRTVLNNT